MKAAAGGCRPEPGHGAVGPRAPSRERLPERKARPGAGPTWPRNGEDRRVAQGTEVAGGSEVRPAGTGGSSPGWEGPGRRVVDSCRPRHAWREPRLQHESPRGPTTPGSDGGGRPAGAGPVAGCWTQLGAEPRGSGAPARETCKLRTPACDISPSLGESGVPKTKPG